MAALELRLSDLEEECPFCWENPGKKLVDGKWVGDKCEHCKGICKIPTATGAAILEFIGRHAPARES